MTDAIVRYENLPVLQAVFAYGSETLVPNNDICRLSYYLKCCIVGCGIDMAIDEKLVDYLDAHNLEPALQENLLRFAFQDLSLDKLLNRAFILDDHHILLPQGTLNTFFEFKLASTFFSINSLLSVAAGQQIHIHKIMLCTSKWIQEYYLDPFIRFQLGNPMIEIRAVPVAPEDEILPDNTDIRGIRGESAGIIVTPIDDPETTRAIVNMCHSCGRTTAKGSFYYRCLECPASELCEQCYNAGRHDQTHSFERVFQTTSSREAIAARVELLTGRDSFVPDVPMAMAVPVDQLMPQNIKSPPDRKLPPNMGTRTG